MKSANQRSFSGALRAAIRRTHKTLVTARVSKPVTVHILPVEAGLGAAMTQAQLPEQLADTQMSRQERSRKKLPMSAIESSGPVSHPPLNSVPARPSVIFNAKRTQRKQLIACHTCCISGFSFNVLSMFSMRGGFSCLVENRVPA